MTAKMAEHIVNIFKPYEFKVGEKINIAAGNRAGDWEVVAMTEKKVTLRCPISKKEFTWDRFCFHVETTTTQWPAD